MSLLRGIVVAAVLVSGWGMDAHAQFAGKMKNPKEQQVPFKNPPTLQTSIDVRDAFIDRIGEDGFYCRLPAPGIVVADTPLFGEFEKVTDTLVTPDWKQLKPEETAVFYMLAGPGATEDQAKGLFDVEAHHWMVVAETVHWWENCKNLTLKLTPYERELAGVRVALAYWKEHDPEVVAKMTAIAATLDKEPSPVPAGQDVPTYFNQHYQKDSTGKDYLWMQVQVLKVAMAETPEPTVIETMNGLK
jgi:hypothetical protein